MTTQEKDILVEVLSNREAAIAFPFEEREMINTDVAPPQEIRTVPHETWQAPGFAISKTLISTLTDMLRERLARGILEPCHGPYSSRLDGFHDTAGCIADD